MGRGGGGGGSSHGGNGNRLLIDFAIFGGIASLLLVIYMYLFVKKHCWSNNNRTKLTIGHMKSYGSTDHHSYDHHIEQSYDNYEEHHDDDHHYSDHKGADVQNSRMIPKHWIKVWP